MRIAGKVVPQAVPTILGEDAQAMAFAMEWLDPKQYPVWKAQLRDGAASVDTARAVGAILGAVHRATAGDADVARDFAHDEGFYAIRLEPYLEASARAHPGHADALRRLIAVTAATRHTLVHGDVSPKNILRGPDGPVFLDAECAWWGDPAFDLAFCLNHLLLKCIWVPPVRDGFLACFRAMTDAYLAHVTWEPATALETRAAHLLLKCCWRPASTEGFLACFDALAASYLAQVDWERREAIERRTAHLLAGLMLGRVDGKSPVEYLTQAADRDRVRRFALRHVAEPVSQLGTLRLRWAQDLAS